MNSYQTVNAAYAAAGRTKQSAVFFGRLYEGTVPAPQSAYEELEQALGRLKAWASPPRDPYDPPSRWNAEDKARQLALRDQSEDRPAPKFVVAYRQITADYGYYEVLRADDRFVWDDMLTAEQAVEMAARREREWAGRPLPKREYE